MHNLRLMILVPLLLKTSNSIRLHLCGFLVASKNLLLVLDLISIPKQRSLAIERRRTSQHISTLHNPNNDTV
jgi:hypothetical protein